MLFDFIRGGQILIHNLKMFKQILKKLFVFSLIVSFIFLCVKFKKDFKIYQIKNTYTYLVAEHCLKLNHPEKLLNIFVKNYKNNETKVLNLTAKNITTNDFLKGNKIKTLNILYKDTILFVLVFIGSMFLIVIIFLIGGYVVNRDNYLRGAKIVSLNVLNKIIKKYNKRNKRFEKNKNFTTRETELLSGIKIKYRDYEIGGALYPYGTETIHTIITGASGTGKTVLITDLINQIRNNGDRAIVYDRMGNFVSKFYNGEEMDKKITDVKNDTNLSEKRRNELIKFYNLKRDIILNPIDKRSPYWSIFNEVRDGLDFDNIASALIPENTNNIDPFWNVAARILFSSVANRLKENNQTSNRDLIDKLLRINLKEAATLVKGTPAQSIIDEQNPKTALSVMSMISTNLKSLIHLRDKKIIKDEDGRIIEEEKPFSIRQWIQNDQQEGFLFISSRADRHETLKPLISTWLDIAINSLLSLEQSTNRKIWIIIDELPSLYYLPSLHTGLAESRQFGGCFVLSMQLMAQLRAIYGKEKAEATSGLCRNRIILNTPDKDTATWCSDNLGKVEMRETKENISFGTNELRDGISINKLETQKNIILPTEVMQLPNLTAYIKFAGDFPVAKSKFKYKNYPKISDRYIENNDNTKNKSEEKINSLLNNDNNVINDQHIEFNEEKKNKNELFNDNNIDLFD